MTTRAAKRSSRRPPVIRAKAIPRLPLASLRVFVAAAEHLSFTQAAHTLGVTAAAVSMQIRALEEYLQEPLFRRRGRNVELTAEGARLLPSVRAGLEQLERAISEARAVRRTGPLTVTTIASFLQQWLLPRLPTLSEAHPNIDLRLHTSVSLVDFAKSDVQAAIRFGTGNWPHLHVEKLLDDWLVPVIAPRLLEKLGPVIHREDLKRHRLVHSVSETWPMWVDADTQATGWAASGATFDDSVSCIRAAENGQGLALARWSLVATEIRNGRLAIAARTVVPAPRAYYFVCPRSYRSLEKVAAFRDWLFAQARENSELPKQLTVRTGPLR